MKYRFTGNIFEVKKITDQFVILYSLDGSMQIMTGKKNLSHSFEKILLDETIKESVPRYDCHETGPPTSGERRSPGYVRRPEENPCMGSPPSSRTWMSPTCGEKHKDNNEILSLTTRTRAEFPSPPGRVPEISMGLGGNTDFLRAKYKLYPSYFPI